MKFLKENNLFSFKLGGTYALERKHTKEVIEDGNTLNTVYTFGCGLKVTNVAKKHEKYGVYEWVNYFENISSENTEVISELFDMDIRFSTEYEGARGKTPWQAKPGDHYSVYSIKGSQSSDWDFSASGGRQYIFPGNTKIYKTIGGRSSDGVAPYFNINKQDKGIITAVGWTGQWNFSVQRGEEYIRLMSKIEDTEFYLEPGEKFRTSSAYVMPYEMPIKESYNAWRRFMKGECSPTVSRVGFLPTCANIWGGTNSEESILRILKFKKAELPITHVWMDAGWSGKETEPTFDEFTGDWYSRVGDWTVSPKVHPQGLCDVVKTAKDCGYKFLLWFEPERARKNVDAVSAHPEYYISLGGDDLLLNLGNDEAYKYIKEKIFGIISSLGLDCYRQDFNFQPLGFWRSNDEENRRGISEIKHINALYRFFDEMLEAFPNLIIDNCASGGRRLDIEMMKRSFPLWRSDAQCPADPTPEAAQMHNINYSMYLPYTGTGCGRIYDTYNCRSAYAPGMGSNYAFSMSDVFGEDEEKSAWLKDRLTELNSIKKYFEGDIYQLTEVTSDRSVWCAVQWNLSFGEEGMIQIFKREDSPYTESVFNLSGIKRDKTYEFTDIDGGSFEVGGEEIVNNGLKIFIKDKRVAKIYTYKTKQKTSSAND